MFLVTVYSLQFTWKMAVKQREREREREKEKEREKEREFTIRKGFWQHLEDHV